MRAHNVLNLEVSEFDVFVPNLLELLRVSKCCSLAVLLRFGSCADHLPRCEDQSCSFGISNTHDSRCKSFRFILYIPTFETNVVKV